MSSAGLCCGLAAYSEVVADLPVLDATEQRVLGSLLEKQRTVPATYPLTLNSLRTACNQSSSRDPVTDLDEPTIVAVCRGLKERELVRTVWADHGRRTLKYHQRLTEQLGLDEAETALVTVLLLRGAQAPGELRTRTERLYAFSGREEVEAQLAAMAQRQPALVRQLPRQPGQKDQRWVHLFGPTPTGQADEHAGDTTETSEPVIDVLADGSDARDARIRQTYATVAERYAARLGDELADLPFERWLLDEALVAADGYPMLDAGCGPGHVTAYLAEHGAIARGIDLTPAMVEQARARYPRGEYAVGDLRRVLRPVDADGWGAVLAWYSLLHLAPPELDDAIAGLARVLRPGGVLLVGLHAGRWVRHVDTWFEHEDLDLDFVAYEPESVVGAMTRAGLTDVQWYRRSPVPTRDETTERLYVLGHSPV